MQSSPITPLMLRAATAADIPAIHAIHVASIRGLCAAAYPAATIEAWASNPDMTRYARMLEPANPSVVAVLEHVLCGFGSLDLPKSRLASLFVHPDHAGTGVGRLLLQKLETLAAREGIRKLQVEASLNARGFYARHGYELIRMGTHCSSNGLRMECAEMHKFLGTR